VGFESTIPVFERAKTVHALVCAATVICSAVLRPTVSRPVCLGVQHHLEPKIRFLLLSVPNLFMGGAISDEKTDLLFTIASYPRQPSHSTVRGPWDSWLYPSVRFETPPTWDPGVSIYFPQERVSQLYPQALCSLFLASYESQSYSGRIGTHLHTGKEDNTSLQTPSGNSVQGKILLFIENHMKHTNALCWQNSKLYYVKESGTYSNHWALKD
jgi:hypothetical protein